jgi:hypothetical protein
MRKLILGFGMALDGYIARREHTFDYLVIVRDDRHPRLGRTPLQPN